MAVAALPAAIMPLVLDYKEQHVCNSGVTTDESTSSIPAEGVVVIPVGLPAARVGELAGVTYRQVDHWTRQGYVVASVNAAVGRGARRLFAPPDVVRVAALGRFGRARLDISLVGPLVAALEPVTSTGRLVVAHLDPLSLEVVNAGDLRDVLAGSGPCVVFDPGPVLQRLNPLGAVVGERVEQPARLRGVS
jgi:hypothetical protein